MSRKTRNNTENPKVRFLSENFKEARKKRKSARKREEQIEEEIPFARKRFCQRNR